LARKRLSFKTCFRSATVLVVHARKRAVLAGYSEKKELSD